MGIDPNKLIEEIYGLGMTPSMGHFKKLNSPFQTSGLNRSQIPTKDPNFAHECEHKLSGWQSQLYNQYKRGKRDAIVSVPPAAGKTAPVLCAWKGEFIKFLEDKLSPNSRGLKVPRIAFIVPTQQLAIQIGKQDFLRDKQSGLLRMVADNPDVFAGLFGTSLPTLTTQAGRTPIRDPITGRQIQQAGVIPVDPITRAPVFIETGKDRYKLAINPKTNSPYINPETNQPYNMQDLITLKSKPHLAKLTPAQIDQLYKFVSSEFVGFLFGELRQSGAYSISSSARGVFGGLKPIIVGTYQPMKKMIQNNSSMFDIVVIDETQEFLGRPGRDNLPSDIADKQSAFIDIIKYTNRNASLFLMTGSTNDETVDEIKDLINTNFNRNLEKIPGKIGLDKDTRNRSKINIMPYDKMQSRQHLLKICRDIVTRRQTNSIMLLFSVKRATMTGIFSLLTELNEKLPIINREYVDTNRRGSLKQRINPRTGFSFEKETKSKIYSLEKELKRITNSEDYEKVKTEIDILKDKISNNQVQFVESAISKLEDKLDKILKDDKGETEYNIVKNQIKRLRERISYELTSKNKFNQDETELDGDNTIKNVDHYDRHIRDRNKDITGIPSMTAKDLADRESGEYIRDTPPLDLMNDEGAGLSDIEFLKYFDIRCMEDAKYKNKPLDRADPNNLLYQAVLRGIGVMTGSLPQRMKETIQKLFKSGKITLLFATDALGVLKCAYKIS